ncbi:hypothetical protein C7H83_10070 [Tetragenococcus halophilus]|uniref:Uncharacterized protein n=1 Tax=Tetragenococcus halophilus TaxID=51669 RepID=A0A3G5FKX8_TETHA|nr:hypothetical protein [Tetragenococcus halophilus]AYW50788.1 hypothetical protein C7H83_10070 [Tetragenococcus halophilus]GBD64869.1 hypothetical protein TEHD23766T_2296 [Tetragenococcus halophilus subsp. flandriensis]GMA08875.1 hypothetical protein GCM10025886_20260 [Tetragenococcus halophilus subsp. flandriensis]
MGLTKLVKNRISSEWKDIFNHNVEQLERKQEENQTSHKATNKRIDNLVLSSGGDSPNEVTDARTDTSGTIHDTLKARIDAGENLTEEEMRAVNEKLSNQHAEIKQLNKTIAELYGGEGGTIDLYVSDERGNDTTADGTEEKPFKTIQGAVNGIPLMNTSSFYIHVEPGSYLEDVEITRILSARLEIVATNNNVTNARKEDTGCYVRSITFTYCNMYCSVRGITQTDVQNSPGHFIYFTGTKYGVISNCRAATNTKNISGYLAFGFNTSTTGHVFDDYIANQYYAVKATFGAVARVANSCTGSGNNVLYHVEGSTIYIGQTMQLQGATEKEWEYGGQVLGL